MYKERKEENNAKGIELYETATITYKYIIYKNTHVCMRAHAMHFKTLYY